MAYQQLTLEHVVTAATGFKGPEGVTVDRDGNVYGGGTDGVIRQLAPDGKVTEFARTGGRPAGIAFDRQGNLFVCPVFDAEGNLYVSNSTDHVLGSIEDVMAEIRNPVPKGTLVRLRPDGRRELVATRLYFANGIAIDPQEAVYVLQSTQNNCVRVTKRKDGTFGKPEVYGEHLGGLPDGMAFDAEGYLIITLPMINRRVVLDPNGKWSALLDDPEGKKTKGPTNCAFGGPHFTDLYLAHLEADHIAKVELGRKGHLLYDRR
jgi:gluconolactonase